MTSETRIAGAELTSGTTGRQQSYRERSKKKKLDVKNGVTMEKLLENHKACNFFVERKARFCGLSKTPGSNFCGIHRAEVGETTLLSRAEKETARIEGTTTLERTCCPQCGDSLFKRALEKHLGICNVSTTERELKKKPYYRENCNAFLSSPTLSKLDAEKGMSSVDPDALLRKVEECFNCYVKLDKSTFLKSPELTAEEEQVMSEVGGEQSSQNKLRHARQDALIVRQVQKVISSSPGEKGTNAKKNVYIEMGAGAGALGYACYCADPTSHIVFVERAPTGKKSLDRTLRRRKLEHKFYRARMDIRHCLISALPGVADVGVKGGGGGKAVVIAKHLCGNASDLAINSLHGGNEEDSEQGQAAAPELAQRQACELKQEQKGLVVATCCHHRCEWDDYVGQQWLTERGFTPQEFEVLTHWSGWGTGLSAWWSGIKSSRRGQEVQADEGESNDIKRRKIGGLDGGDGDSDKEDEDENEEGNEEGDEGEEDNEHQYKPSLKGFPRPAGITKETMALSGFKTKRILDQGRCEALRAAGYNARQVQFCSPKDSPECYCIVTS